MSKAKQLARDYAESVCTEGRVHNTMHVAGVAHTTVTSVVEATFEAGYKAAMKDMPLSFVELFAANVARVARWHALNSWSPLEWAGAMCGEAGEAANFAKKLKRLVDQIPNHDARCANPTFAEYKRGILHENADAAIYGVLMCASVGASAEEFQQAIRDAFNAKSIEYGFPERI